MPTIIKSAFVSLVLSILSACASLPTATSGETCDVGRDFEPQVFERLIKRGSTTQLQVDSWLGTPHAIGVAVEPNGVRYEEWVYYYSRCRTSSAGESQLKSLTIKFDRQGIVRAYEWWIGQNVRDTGRQ